MKASETAVQKQQNQISGTITDDTDQPLPGATIIVKGTSTGTTTDFDGKFILQIDDEDAVLLVSYIGFYFSRNSCKWSN